jgi:hypothetical protein
VRIRVQRFRDLKPVKAGARFVEAGCTAPRFDSGFTLSAPGEFRLAPRPSLRFERYCSRSRFGPLSLTGLLYPLLTPAAGSASITRYSVLNPRPTAGLSR